MGSTLKKTDDVKDKAARESLHTAERDLTSNTHTLHHYAQRSIEVIDSNLSALERGDFLNVEPLKEMHEGGATMEEMTQVIPVFIENALKAKASLEELCGMLPEGQGKSPFNLPDHEDIQPLLEDAPAKAAEAVRFMDEAGISPMKYESDQLMAGVVHETPIKGIISHAAARLPERAADYDRALSHAEETQGKIESIGSDIAAAAQAAVAGDLERLRAGGGTHAHTDEPAPQTKVQTPT